MRYSSWFLLAILVFFLGGLTGDFVLGCFWTIFLIIVGIYQYIQCERNAGNMPYKGQQSVTVDEYIHTRGIDKCYWLSHEEQVKLAQLDNKLKQLTIGYMLRNIEYGMAASMVRIEAVKYNSLDGSQFFETDRNTELMYWKVINKEKPEEFIRLVYPIWGLKKNEDDNNEKYKEI